MEEDIYVNLEELQGAATGCSSQHGPASHCTTGTSSQRKPRTSDCPRSEHGRRGKLEVDQGSKVKVHTRTRTAVGGPASISVEPEHGRCRKPCVLLVSLLCLLLLAAVTALSVRYHRDVHQLATDLANQTVERHLLLLRYHILRQERDQLNATYRRMMKEAVKCPDGWTKFGCSCYLLENSRDSWERSRMLCQTKGGDLVIVTSMEEMVFLNKLGVNLRFWIGLNSTAGLWTWTNGKHLEKSYWISRRYYSFQTCAAFNSFPHPSPLRPVHSVKSWTPEYCPTALQRVCEKEATPTAAL
ncbi:C-type lectin domain family 17, member A-like [Salarias fasciatus]|uniref:C-type lectin domain family 17, member A-like n=1 Tax=Salarias fasciatus TaxID=181472 RepID=UPI001176CBB7|nr:C-type lectin domain family 17, member A-like [Salarias fasciatus]